MLCRLVWLVSCFSVGRALLVAKKQQRRKPGVLAASSSSSEERLQVVFVVGDGPSEFGLTSPEPRPEWREVATQLCSRLQNFDERIDGVVVGETDDFNAVGKCVLVALGVKDEAKLRNAVEVLNPVAVAAEPTSTAPLYAGAYKGSIIDDALTTIIPWGEKARGKRVLEQAQTLLSRYSSEDAAYAVMFLLNGFITGAPIQAVSTEINPSWEKGVVRNAQEFANMAQCCGPEIKAALSDPQTKKAVDLLNGLDLRDQVGSYRVIVSNETPQLEAFTLCILQQNNCFNADARILEKPVVPPLPTWRGAPLDQEASRAILIGHLDDEDTPWSWKIVAGANPAYDAFPCQHQIFYPSSKKREALWYDPVFLVETLDGEKVWTKRHYRCTTRGIGRWTLTTLDNGMVSLEHWTIVDAADDLEWCVLHYSGAAKNAGQSYQGALLCSADGKWPKSAIETDSAAFKRIRSAFDASGLELWELYGHGPPTGDEASFMWSQAYRDFVQANPPPLDKIGDKTITKWRKEVIREEEEKKEKQLLQQ